MGGFRRTVHTNSSFAFDKVEKIVPDATIQGTNNQTGEPVQMFALAITDADDGETHVYTMDENYKRTLVALLTGGVFIPTNGEVIKH